LGSSRPPARSRRLVLPLIREGGALQSPLILLPTYLTQGQGSRILNRNDGTRGVGAKVQGRIMLPTHQKCVFALRARDEVQGGTSTTLFKIAYLKIQKQRRAGGMLQKRKRKQQHERKKNIITGEKGSRPGSAMAIPGRARWSGGPALGQLW